jgi:hypothetical protein
MGCGGVGLLSLSLGTNVCDWSASQPQSPNAQAKNPRYPVNMKLARPQNRLAVKIPK